MSKKVVIETEICFIVQYKFEYLDKLHEGLISYDNLPDELQDELEVIIQKVIMSNEFPSYNCLAKKINN